MLRKTLLVTNEIYHVYNRGVEKRPIFLNRRDYSRFFELAKYYRFAKCPVKFSHLKQLSKQKREGVLNKLDSESEKLVDILAYCLMPNHVHFLLRQLQDNGISKFVGKVTNGYSHYFNLRNERVGHLFQGNFSAVRIETDEQLIHVSRYTHLNPIASYLIEPNYLEKYEYSSYSEYLGLRKGFCNIQNVLSLFKNIEAYKKFVLDQADYARTLENIKHLSLEN